MLTIHSMKSIGLQIEESFPGRDNDFDTIANRIILEKDGKENEKEPD